METQVDVLRGDDSTTHIVSWRKGKPPKDHKGLNKDLALFPDGEVIPTDDEGTGKKSDASYIIILDDEAEPDGVLDIFRSYGYDVRRALSD